jgi:GT2 family glycosyltransferase
MTPLENSPLIQFAFLILSYNHPEYTKRTVNHLNTQLNKTKHLRSMAHVGIIHNGGHKKIVDDLKREYPELLHIEIEENFGFTGGVNGGFDTVFHHAEFQCSWCLIISNDCDCMEIDEEKFQRLKEKVGFLGIHQYARKMPYIDSHGGQFTPSLGALKHLKHSSEFFSKTKGRLWKTYPYLPGASFLIHREVYLTLGPFDQSLHSYFEDVDYSLRYQRLNILKDHWEKMGIFPGISFVHRLGKTNRENPYYTTYLYWRNRRIVSLRYGNLCERFVFCCVYTFGWLKMVIKIFQSTKNHSVKKKKLLYLMFAWRDELKSESDFEK